MKTKYSSMVICSLMIVAASSALGTSMSTPLKHNLPGRGIMASWDETGQVWYLTQNGQPEQPMRPSPETSFNQIVQLAVSPNDHYLAVLSVGEGHPAVDVFDLGNLLHLQGEKSDATLSPLGTVNSFPGTMDIVGWSDGAQLSLASDVPLDRLDKETRMVTGATDTEDRCSFLWNVVDDSIVRDAPVVEKEPSDREMLASFLAGNYVLVGKKADSDGTFLGTMTIIADGEKITGERRIAEQATPFSGTLETPLCCDNVTVLVIRFEENGRSFEATYMYQSDLDNNARLTGYCYERGKETEWPGMETLFPDFHP